MRRLCKYIVGKYRRRLLIPGCSYACRIFCLQICRIGRTHWNQVLKYAGECDCSPSFHSADAYRHYIGGHSSSTVGVIDVIALQCRLPNFSDGFSDIVSFPFLKRVLHFTASMQVRKEALHACAVLASHFPNLVATQVSVVCCVPMPGCSPRAGVIDMHGHSY